MVENEIALSCLARFLKIAIHSDVRGNLMMFTAHGQLSNERRL